MKIEYIFKHTKDGDIQKEVFTLDVIEKGAVLDYIEYMRKDGYELINRLPVEDYLLLNVDFRKDE